eukprot:TRINITY_DN4261_c0_g1_i1.p1 TRINITY_DN4261_c0_g1~~TRINITY_DN4261_c0_g1_i1.p1  ORF type:complete len:499 (+),score=90.72 TRINITY_DN4261_c0_g1_i1:25-1521(+)
MLLHLLQIVAVLATHVAAVNEYDNAAFWLFYNFEDGCSLDVEKVTFAEIAPFGADVCTNHFESHSGEVLTCGANGEQHQHRYVSNDSGDARVCAPSTFNQTATDSARRRYSVNATTGEASRTCFCSDTECANNHLVSTRDSCLKPKSIKESSKAFPLVLETYSDPGCKTSLNAWRAHSETDCIRDTNDFVSLSFSVSVNPQTKMVLLNRTFNDGLHCNGTVKYSTFFPAGVCSPRPVFGKYLKIIYIPNLTLQDFAAQVGRPAIGTRYVVNTNKRTYDEAQRDCQAIGGQLPTIVSQVKYEQMLAAVDAAVDERSFSVWLGAKFPKETDELEWSDGSASGLLQWKYPFGPGEPSVGGRRNQCLNMQVRRKGELTGIFRARKCSKRRMSVCEVFDKDAAVAPPKYTEPTGCMQMFFNDQCIGSAMTSHTCGCNNVNGAGVGVHCDDNGKPTLVRYANTNCTGFAIEETPLMPGCKTVGDFGIHASCPSTDIQSTPSGSP